MATTANNTVKTAATKRSTTAKKAAATRQRKAAQAAAPAAPKTPVERVTEYAEKAVLVPVGAALVARDTLVSSVEEIVTTYTSRDKAEKDLKARQRKLDANLRKFERRGTTARNRAVREVKRAQTKVERELRQRRNETVRIVKRNSREAERQVKATGRDMQDGAESIVNRVASIA